MKRYSLLLAVLATALFLSAVSACYAVYPQRDGDRCIQMLQGYFDGNLAWYICTDTSNYRYAQSYELNFAPKLDSAYLIAPPAYTVRNPLTTQEPVFSARPGDDNYSGIWTLWCVTWNDLNARVKLTSEQQILDLEAMGLLSIEPCEERIVVNYPIVALGRLGGPWLAKPDPPFYRIPQAIEHDFYSKTIKLPTYKVVCSETVSQEPIVRKIVITDVADPALAEVLGANLAPGLLDIPLSDTQRFWVRRGPKPPSELPLIEFCPGNYAEENKEFGYSPVMQYTILHSNLPPYTVVSSKRTLLKFIDGGLLEVVKEDQVINAPVLPNKAYLRICSLATKLYLADFLIPDNDRINMTLNGRPILTDFQLPILLRPACIPLILRQGDNILEITALNTGRLTKPKVNSVGVLFEDVCPGYSWSRYFDVYADIFPLQTGEKATLILRTR